jgi:hypothetical protein
MIIKIFLKNKVESLGAGVPALVCKHQMDIDAHSYYKTEMKRNEIY